MNYRQFDNKTLKKLAAQLKYDRDHMMRLEKRQQAKQELMLVEAELKDRRGLNGLIRQLKRIVQR